MTQVFDPNFHGEMEKFDIKDINYRYEQEGKMMDTIYHGNFEEYKELLAFKDAPDNFDVRVSRTGVDNLRERKNGLTTRKTLMRVAAKQGGVPPIYLHIISTKFSRLIEQATSSDFLDNVLAHEMAKAYCEAVLDYSIKNYTPTIQAAILYIDSHLTERLSVKEVADELHFHPSYLSRKFKQETGRNLTDYVNGQRIEFAKSQFRTGSMNVTNVALTCGYSSSSYFSKVFKSYTGVFPTEYIKQSIENFHTK